MQSCGQSTAQPSTLLDWNVLLHKNTSQNVTGSTPKIKEQEVEGDSTESPSGPSLQVVALSPASVHS